MHMTTDIHNVTAIQASALQTIQHDNGRRCYWRTFVFITGDGGQVSVTAFTNDPAALPAIPAQPQQEQTA